MENAHVLRILIEQRNLYRRLFTGPEPDSISEEVQVELNEAIRVFIDKLMLRACALAAFRCQCKTRKDFQEKRIVLIADDIDQAWVALNSELQ